jgi:phosphate transport system substrate-binding protein
MPHGAALALSLFITLQTLPAQEGPLHAESLKAPADPSLPHFVADPSISGHLTSVGTDTMDDLMKLWIAGFQEPQPAIALDLQSQASMSVPAALTAGVAQLAPLSRELNPSEVEAFRAKHGYAPTEIAVALGSFRTPTRTVALTFYVSDANPITHLDLQQLDAMWCTTLHRGAKQPLTEWGQLGLSGDWAHRPIHLVGVLPPDGVPNFVTRRVCNGGLLRDGIHGEKNGGPISVLTRIVEDVAQDPDAIGYAGFHNRQPGTHPIRIANTAEGPFYEGTFNEVRSAAYPLTRFVYIYLDRPPNAPLAPPTREFLRYVLSLEGQRKIEQEGIFMPLPPRIAAQQRTKLE